MRCTAVYRAPNAFQAEACRTGTLYVVNIVSAQGSVLSEVAFNSETGCLGANTVKVTWPTETTAVVDSHFSAPLYHPHSMIIDHRCPKPFVRCLF